MYHSQIIRRSPRYALLMIAAQGLLMGTTDLSRAEFTNFSYTGPGGTAILEIDESNKNIVNYWVDFVQIAPITITFTVDSPGQYRLGPMRPDFFSAPPLLNLTTETITALHFELLNAPVNSRMFSAGWSNKHFSDVISPSPTERLIHGGDGIAPRDAAFISASFIITSRGSGPVTFDVRITPTGSIASVPEPSTIALTGMGTLTGLAWSARRRRRTE